MQQFFFPISIYLNLSGFFSTISEQSNSITFRGWETLSVNYRPKRQNIKESWKSVKFKHTQIVYQKNPIINEVKSPMARGTLRTPYNEGIVPLSCILKDYCYRHIYTSMRYLQKWSEVHTCTPGGPHFLLPLPLVFSRIQLKNE